MSKKSVSDIMKPVVIFPNDQSPYMTSRFEVRNHPVILRAFGIDCDTVGHIEMGYNDGCGGWFWGPYIPDCDQLALLGCANAIAIGLPGWYRIVFRDRITGEPSTGLDDLVVTITETDMPASMLAQFSGGSASMACGSQVSIREEDGCFYISVDNQAYAICPGDSVSCDPNGLGIVINGELCPFPPRTEVSVSINEDGCLVIVVDGEATVFCPSPDSVTIIDALADDIYQATNPDGSVIQWNGANSITLVDEFEDGQFRATNPDGSSVDWDGNNSITVVSDLGEGQFQAENPDGSLVTWDGENSVTLADANTAEGTITITNPDGSQVTFLYLEELPETPPQTRVVRGTGGQAAQHTLTAQHGGTWPNESWRETWMERNGDIVEIHSWNPNTNSWDSVAIEAPENIVILNNPVIYINSATGTSNPPIETQADLATNPFDSFQSVRSFMNRTLVVGRVTLDIRGRFENVGNMGSAFFKNAPITIRGNNGEFAQAIIEWGHAGTGNDRVGLSIQSGGVTVQDVTFEGHDEAEGDFAAAINMQVNGALELSGTIAFTGTYDNTRPGSSVGTLVRQIADNSQITVSGHTTLRYAMTGGANVREAFVVGNGSRLTFGGNVIIQNAWQAITFALGFLNINATSGMRLSTAGAAPNPIEVQGSVRHIAPSSVVISPLASVNTTAAYGNRAATINYDFGVDVSSGGAQATMQIDAIGVLDDVAGP